MVRTRLRTTATDGRKMSPTVCALCSSETAAVDVDEIMTQLRSAQAAIQQIEGQAESDDGLVRVSVGLGGELKGLELDPRIYRTQDAQALAKSIVETAGRALQDAERQGFVAVKPFLNEDSELETTDLAFDPALTQLSKTLGE